MIKSAIEQRVIGAFNARLAESTTRRSGSRCARVVRIRSLEVMLVFPVANQSVNPRSISSSDLPLVSGTLKNTKTKPAKQIAA